MKMICNGIEVEMTINEVKFETGHMDQSVFCYEAHKRGKNWVATVEFDAGSPGGLKRNFWKHGSGSYVEVPENLRIGDHVEIAADYVYGSGRRKMERIYIRILQINEKSLIYRKAGKPIREEHPNVLEEIKAAGLERVIDPNLPDIAPLIEERARLVSRINEIDLILNS